MTDRCAPPLGCEAEWHWLRHKSGSLEMAWWLGDAWHFLGMRTLGPVHAARHYTYVAPCLPPDEADVLREEDERLTARVAFLEENNKAVFAACDAEITRLRAEIENLTALRAQNERLKEALAEIIDDEATSAARLARGWEQETFVNILKIARAALAETETKL